MQALERRINELEEENESYRKALDLPPSSRPSLGRGPTGQNQPDHGADESRCQTVSPSRESAGSPSSCPGSPELGNSLIAPSISSHAMTMDIGPPHQTTVESVSILAPSPPNHSDRILTRLHSPPIAISSQRTLTSYSSISEGFVESNFDAREPRRREAHNEVQHNFYSLSPNYPSSNQYQHTAASMHPQSYHDPNLSHREWTPLLSKRLHTFRDQIYPEGRQFPRPPSPEQAHPSHPVQHPGYNRRPGLSRPQPHSDAYG